MPAPPRVAFFTDTYEEINGVALTSRQFTAYALRHGLPFICFRGGQTSRETIDGSVRHVELKRGPLAFHLDKGLLHDPLIWRFGRRVGEILRDFRPDIIHVVSPGDVSEVGVYHAKKMKLPLAISWHTNLHEFGAMRLKKALPFKPLVKKTEQGILEIVLAFYRLGNVLYAPNDELVEMLEHRTKRPVFLMKRGIDTALFNPARRTVRDDVLHLGYVGRITPEKGVRFLRKLETGLRAAGVPDFRFLIVGDGSERAWLGKNLMAADLPGILRGEPLAEAYANMDVFVFPSRTDTFGNVVLEAFASGVPAVVTNAGGPRFIVRHDISGFVAENDSEFIAHTAALLRDSELRRRMAGAAREQACKESWDSVFEKVYTGYEAARSPDGELALK